MLLGFDHPWLFGVSASLAVLVAAGFAILAQQAPRPGEAAASAAVSLWDLPGALALGLALLAWQLVAAPRPVLLGQHLAPLGLLLLGLCLLALRLLRADIAGARLGAALALLAAVLLLPLTGGGAEAAVSAAVLAPGWPAAAAVAALPVAVAGVLLLSSQRRRQPLVAVAGGMLLLAALLGVQFGWRGLSGAATLAEPQAGLMAALPLALLSVLLLAGRRQDARLARSRELRLAALEQRQLLLAGDAERLLRENANCARQAEARLELLLGGADIGSFDWDLITGSVRYGGRWAEMLGYEPQQIEPHCETWARLTHPADFETLQRELALHLSGERPRLACELRMRNAQRHWQWVRLQGQVVERSAEGRPRRLLGTQSDIDAFKREQLAQQGERRLFGAGPVRRLLLEAQPPHRLRQGDGLLSEAAGDAVGACGKPLADWVHGEDLATVSAAAARAVAEPGSALHCELRLAQSDGGWRWMLLHAVADPAGAEGEPGLLRGYLVDIDGLKQAQAAASTQGADLRALVGKMGATQRFLEGLQEMTEQLQLCNSAEAGRALVARAGQALFPGWDGALAFVGTDGLLSLDARWGSFVAPAARLGGSDCWALRLGRLHHVACDAVPDGAPVCGHFGGGQRLPEGVAHTLCVPLSMAPGAEPAGALQLATGQPLGEAELRIAIWGAESFAHALRLALANLALRLSLRDQAVRDWLTGLFNRRHFDEALHQELRRAERSDDNLVVALLDIDHFKAFNDAFGHDAGDAVIRAVASELHGFVRSYDTAARVGGEELAVLLPKAHLEETCARLNLLRERIAGLSLSYEGVALPGITISVGVADIAHGPADNLLQRADQAMYMSKHRGRDRLTCWEPDLPTVSELAQIEEAREAAEAAPAAAI